MIIEAADLIEFLRNHREELVILHGLVDDEEDRDEVERRIECVDALLLEKGVRMAGAMN